MLLDPRHAAERSRRARAAPVSCRRSSRAWPDELVDWGSTKAVGLDLFGAGLFPFEAISILLLIAVVGAIAIARPLRGRQHARPDDPVREDAVNDILFNIGYGHFLVLAAVLFLIGVGRRAASAATR